jgi:hypothetical protein
MNRHRKKVETISVHIAFTIRKYGGRKQVVVPAGVPDPELRPQIDSTLVKALGRSFRWKHMLECGNFATIRELAEHEKLGFSYMTRVLRLSLLAPEIVEAILDGRQSAEMKLADLLEPFPAGWKGQNEQFA